jgi:hypothetical protein
MSDIVARLHTGRCYPDEAAAEIIRLREELARWQRWAEPLGQANARLNAKFDDEAAENEKLRGLLACAGAEIEALRKRSRELVAQLDNAAANDARETAQLRTKVDWLIAENGRLGMALAQARAALRTIAWRDSGLDAMDMRKIANAELRKPVEGQEAPA